MRILRLDLGGDIGTIDLHPFISVLHDFHPVQGAALVNAIRSLVNGSGDGVSGLVENAGHLVELSGDGADPIGPLTTEDVLFQVDDLAVGDLGDPSILEAELDQVRRAAQIDAVYVEEIRADLKPSVAAQVQRLRDQLDGLATDGKSAEVEALDRLKLAVEETSAVPPILREIPEEVEELISSWDNFVGIRDEAQPHIDELQQVVQRADAALGRAQQELAEAKAEARPVLLTPEEDSRLEELAHPSVDRRGRSKGISPDEEAEMQKILAKVDVPTYTGYAMYRLNPTPSAEKMAELQLAEARVDTATAELEEARAALEIDPVATDLNFEFDLVKAKARAHLGPMLPSDLGGALGKLVVETENPEYMEALRRLYDIAAAEDVPFPDNLEPLQLPEAVTNWVAHREAQLASGPSADPVQVEADLAKAESALDRHARAMGRIDRLETKSLESAARVRELEDKIERVTAGTGMSADTVLSQVEPLIARIKEQNGTSVPILLAGDFTDLADSEIDAMMSQLELVAQDHQLIVLSDRRQAAVWAANAGLRRALRSTVNSNEDTHGIID